MKKRWLQSQAFHFWSLTLLLAAVIVSPAQAYSLDRALRNALSAPEIGFALGAPMRLIDLESQNPSFPKIRSQLEALPETVLKSNTPVLYFPGISVSYRGEKWILVVTEDGLWGMTPFRESGKRRMLTQTDVLGIVEDFQATRRTWIFVKEPIPLLGGLVTLTPGEIYPLDTSESASVLLEENGYFTGSKHRDVMALGSSVTDRLELGPEIRIPLGDNYSSKIDYIEIYGMLDYVDAPISDWTRSRSTNIRALYANWNKFFSIAKDNISDCNQIIKIETDDSYKRDYEARIKLGIDSSLAGLTQFLSNVGLTASLGGGVSGEITESITSTLTIGHVLYEYRTIVLESGGQTETYIIGNSRQCEDSGEVLNDSPVYRPAGPRFFRMKKSDLSGFAINEEIFQHVTEDVPSIRWNENAGTLDVASACYARDIEAMRSYLKRELKLTPAEIELFISRAVTVDESSSQPPC